MSLESLLLTLESLALWVVALRAVSIKGKLRIVAPNTCLSYPMGHCFTGGVKVSPKSLLLALKLIFLR